MPKRHVFDFYNDRRYAFAVQLKNTSCTEFLNRQQIEEQHYKIV